jgi:hypothetical protein
LSAATTPCRRGEGHPGGDQGGQLGGGQLAERRPPVGDPRQSGRPVDDQAHAGGAEVDRKMVVVHLLSLAHPMIGTS